MKEFIEISFGAKDSELEGWEYNIPEGYTASIENGKIIVKKEESEDEIRKSIIGFLKTIASLKDGKTVSNEDFDSKALLKWTTWLEKQGDIDRRIQEEIEKQTKQLWKAEKQCELKFRVGDVMRTWQEAFNGIKDGLPVVVAIDDENYRCNNEIISITDQEDYEYPPMNRKQKFAWSEDDEDYRNDVNAAVNDFYDEGYAEELRDWLKSLKERFTWKPSDEQLNALDEVYETHGTNNVNRRIIFNLLEQLKKL